MLYRKLTSDGDYTFGGNAQNFYSGKLAVSQAIKTNLLLLYGEWWEDTEEGLPLFDSIIGLPGNQDNIEAATLLVRERISNTKGVESIEELNVLYENRTLSISGSVGTIYGDIILEEVIF